MLILLVPVVHVGAFVHLSCEWCFQMGKVNDHLSGKERFILFSVRIFHEPMYISYISCAIG